MSKLYKEKGGKLDINYPITLDYDENKNIKSASTVFNISEIKACFYIVSKNIYVPDCSDRCNYDWRKLENVTMTFSPIIRFNFLFSNGKINFSIISALVENYHPN